MRLKGSVNLASSVYSKK